MTGRKRVMVFRWTALAEAVSYLVLLGIAMPLKYVWDMPMAVRVVGSLHGALFVLFCVSLALAMRAGGWSRERGVMLFVASLIPFLPFWLDRRVKKWAEAVA